MARPKRLDIQKDSDKSSYAFDLCKWIALKKTHKQIIDLIEDHYGIQISSDTISYYARSARWRKIISYLRERFLKNISRIPVASRDFRLCIINEALNEALTYHTKTINQYGRIDYKNLGVISNLIREAREEMAIHKDEKDGMQLHLNLVTLIRNSKNGNGRIKAGDVGHKFIGKREHLDKFLEN